MVIPVLRIIRHACFCSVASQPSPVRTIDVEDLKDAHYNAITLDGRVVVHISVVWPIKGTGRLAARIRCGMFRGSAGCWVGGRFHSRR
jgi:hypothetical protein